MQSHSQRDCLGKPNSINSEDGLDQQYPRSENGSQGRSTEEPGAPHKIGNDETGPQTLCLFQAPRTSIGPGGLRAAEHGRWHARNAQPEELAPLLTSLVTIKAHLRKCKKQESSLMSTRMLWIDSVTAQAVKDTPSSLCRHGAHKGTL